MLSALPSKLIPDVKCWLIEGESPLCLRIGMICPVVDDESVRGGEGVPFPEDESIETD